MTMIGYDVAHGGVSDIVHLTVDGVTAASALAAAMEDVTSSAPGFAALDPNAALGSNPVPYILYEKDGEILFAAGEVAVLTLDRAGLHLTTEKGTLNEPLRGHPLEQLQAMLARLPETADLPDPHWRAYGWMAFEFSYLLHGLAVPEDAGTLLHLLVPRHEVRVQQGTAEMRVTDRSVAALWRDALCDADPHRSERRVRVDELDEADGYLEAAAAAIEAIDKRRLRKVILSRSVRLAEDVDLVGSYRALRDNNTPARSFLLRLGGMSAAGVSPEAVIEVAADGAVTTQPLAGTRALTGQVERDAALRDELLSDPKEIYEHALSVKLAQEEIEAVSLPGTVAVENFMHVVSRGSVQHLASRVRGQLRTNASCWDALGGAFPSVTASGIPKRRACEEILRRERTRRGLYSGAVLTADWRGELDAALVLRSVYQRDGSSWLRAGAGLVAQSNAERELEETREKLRSVSRFIVPRARAVA